jgi:hypothetical protein
MGVLKRQMQWAKDAPVRSIDYMPDSEGWLDAVQLPIAVIVGDLDTDAIPESPERNHRERAARWVDSMYHYALEHGVTCRLSIVTVPKVGHDSQKLSPTAVRILFGDT